MRRFDDVVADRGTLHQPGFAGDVPYHLFYQGSGMTAFNTSSVTIGQLLDSATPPIVVPEFQRGYSWEKRHVKAFWDDIRAFQSDEPLKGKRNKHFLGPIVVIEQDEQVLLLDGQQRIATATILFSVIRNRALRTTVADGKVFATAIQSEFIHKEDYGYTLKMGELDETYFRESVQAMPSELVPIAPKVKKIKPTVRSNRNIATALTFLEEEVDTLMGNAEPAAVLAQLKGLRNTVRNGLVMAKILVTSEDDAYHIFETLNDRGLRLSVPDLLLNLLMRSAPKDDRKAVRQTWTEVVSDLKSADPRDFVRHMWVSRYGDLKRGGLFVALKKHVKDKNPLEYAQECAEESEKYSELLYPDKEVMPDNTVQALTRLLQNLNIHSSLPLLLSCYRSLSEDQFRKVVQLVLVFVTRYSLVTGLDVSGMETLLFKLARDVRAKIAAGETAKACVDHIRDTLESQAPDDDQIKLHIPRAEMTHQGAKYILSRIADYQLSNDKQAKTADTNLEHIFPQNPSDEWPNSEELDPLLWNIGNLTIFGRRRNKDVGNRGFEFKKSKYKASPIQMTSMLCGYNEWNVDAVKNRAAHLGNLVVELWDFRNPTRA